MKKIRIRLGCFYNGNLVELEAGKKIHLRLTMAEYQGRGIAIGYNQARHLLPAFSLQPPVSILATGENKNTNRQPVSIPGPEKYPAHLYIEIVASREIEAF